LTQFDTALHGRAIARELLDLGVARASLKHLRWVLTTQRMPALCPHCKSPAALSPEQAARIVQRYPHLGGSLERIIHPEPPRGRRPVTRAMGGFHQAAGCERCCGTGYLGDLSVYDLYRNDPREPSPFDQPSLLSFEEYALTLAAQGELDLDDLLELDSARLRRTYHMLTASEKALTTANSALSRKLLELEASNRVLVQRTEVLMSLEDLGQALISSAPLTDLAGRICRRAGDLCGADRVALYLRRLTPDNQETAEILGARGWAITAGRQVPAEQVFAHANGGYTARFMHNPPGVQPRQERGDEGSPPAASMGLSVPLVAQDLVVGVMIVQSTIRESFTPGEVALLQTFANQAALAIQRAGLVDDLRAKIAQLEAAQAELVTKERLERELELARQVQQSMLPHDFPHIPGVLVAARNQPARQVGGDFYDLFWLDDDHFGIVIADVADKGMPAALYMALTRSLLLAEARRAPSPRAALTNVNRLLRELGELSGFVSVFYGVIERFSRGMVYTRAGHERPFLLREGQALALGGEGAVLGVLDEEELNLSEERITLLAGDRLVLFTDGLTDAADPRGVFFGLARLKRLLGELAGVEPETICQAVFSALGIHRAEAEQFDDMTLLVIGFQADPAQPGAAPSPAGRSPGPGLL